MTVSGVSATIADEAAPQAPYVGLDYYTEGGATGRSSSGATPSASAS